jgi:chromosomal replication initiation ATPase DnaA
VVMLVKEPENYPEYMQKQSMAAANYFSQMLYGPDIEALKREITKREIIINELRARVAELELARLANTPCNGRLIANEIAKQHGFTFRQLISPRRDAKIAQARQHAMWQLDRDTNLSLPQIGKLMGDRDHTTILHGIRAHARRMAKDA